jgi:hypothetical protein
MLLLGSTYASSESGRFAHVPAEFLHKMMAGFLAVPASDPHRRD